MNNSLAVVSCKLSHDGVRASGGATGAGGEMGNNGGGAGRMVVAPEEDTTVRSVIIDNKLAWCCCAAAEFPPRKIGDGATIFVSPSDRAFSRCSFESGESSLVGGGGGGETDFLSSSSCGLPWLLSSFPPAPSSLSSTDSSCVIAAVAGAAGDS